MSKIIIEKKSILDFNTDIVVNAANEYLQQGGGVCGVIFNKAGSAELTRTCNKYGHCDTGDAVITPAFNLKNYKYIIHAVGPVYYQSKKQYCRNTLYSAYYKSLELMVKNGCNSITFPLISSGIFSYPVEEAWRVALKACNKFIINNSDKDISIYFAIIADDVYELGNSILKDVLLQRHDSLMLRLFEAVSILHKSGFQKLRISTHMSPNGMGLRCILANKDYFDPKSGFIFNKNLNESCDICHISSALSKNDFNDIGDVEKLVKDLLDGKDELIGLTRGRDEEYVKWFDEVLKLARNGIYPYAYDDSGYHLYDEGRIRLINDDGYIDYAPF